MKVCQLCAVDFTLKNFLLPLIDGMRSQGWDVEAVCSDGPAIPALREKGYRIQTVRIARSMNPFGALVSTWKLIQLFRRERYDVLHVHTPVAALLARIAARLTGIPMVVYTAHGFYFHEGMKPWKYKFFVFLERLAGRWTDLLFTQSSEDARTAVIEGIKESGKVVAIGNGVCAARFDPDSAGAGELTRKELGIPAGAYVIGMIGRQVREKGVVEFLVAARKLAALHSDVWFLLIGDRLASDHAESISADLAEAQAALGTRLLTPGLRDDIPNLLSAMDLFCLPSWREGMPRTIIEAMMMAKPVVATDIRGSREEVVSETTGLLVPVRSPDELADAFGRFVADPAWGRGLGAAGRRRALELYDESKVVELQLRWIKDFAPSYVKQV